MEDVTSRDIEIAQQLGAPAEVIESLKRGVWPEGSTARDKIRNAEACIDYLHNLYGEEFSALTATGGPKWMTDLDDVTLLVETGPHAHEEVYAKYYPGDENHEPVISEDYYYILNHEEWERIATAAVTPIFSDLPSDWWILDVNMSRQLYERDQSSKPLQQGGTGDIDVRIAMNRCSMDMDSMAARLALLQEALQETRLSGICAVYGYTVDSDTASFTLETLPPFENRIWYQAVSFGIDGQ